MHAQFKAHPSLFLALVGGLGLVRLFQRSGDARHHCGDRSKQNAQLLAFGGQGLGNAALGKSVDWLVGTDELVFGPIGLEKAQLVGTFGDRLSEGRQIGMHGSGQVPAVAADRRTQAREQAGAGAEPGPVGELLARDARQMVRLVEHEQRVAGIDQRAVRLQRGEDQCVVGDLDRGEAARRRRQSPFSMIERGPRVRLSSESAAIRFWCKSSARPNNFVSAMRRSR